MIEWSKALIKRLPYINKLHGEIFGLREELRKYRTWVPPGHYYSPIPSVDEVLNNEHFLFPDKCDEMPGIDMRQEEQISLLKSFERFYSEMPFQANKSNGLRYYFENSYYSYADGIILYSMIRHTNPKRIIEVGSGYSSAAILDTNDLFLNGEIKCTFIDPDTDRLSTLLNESDKKRTNIICKRIQEVPLEIFLELAAGDILFVDSSHVSKTGSDVNRILFELLPALNSGVYIHFHDVFYQFEYPRKWVYSGMAWNEAYILRAFLQYNDMFEICLFTSYLVKCHREAMISSLPLAITNEPEDPTINDAPGSSIWIKKV